MFGKGTFIIVGLLCQYPCVEKLLTWAHDFLHLFGGKH
jgi:hypothetical protein